MAPPQKKPLDSNPRAGDVAQWQALAEPLKIQSSVPRKEQREDNGKDLKVA